MLLTFSVHVAADEYSVIQEHREKQDNYLDQISEALDVIKDGAKVCKESLLTHLASVSTC